jgi:hypothetical protein
VIITEGSSTVKPMAPQLNWALIRLGLLFLQFLTICRRADGVKGISRWNSGIITFFGGAPDGWLAAGLVAGLVVGCSASKTLPTGMTGLGAARAAFGRQAHPAQSRLYATASLNLSHPWSCQLPLRTPLWRRMQEWTPAHPLMGQRKAPAVMALSPRSRWASRLLWVLQLAGTVLSAAPAHAARSCCSRSTHTFPPPLCRHKTSFTHPIRSMAAGSASRSSALTRAQVGCVVMAGPQARPKSMLFDPR